MGQGNLAYKWDNAVLEEEIREKRKKVTSVRKKQTAKNRVLFVTYVLAVIFAAIFMIGKNVAKYEGELEIKRLEKELASIESYTSQKLFELEENTDLTAIEEEAINRLGMQRPAKNQIVYVNIKQDDICELTSKDSEGIFSNK